MIVPSLANKGPMIVAKDLCEELVTMGHKCKIFYFDEIIDLTMPCDVERISFWDTIDFYEWDIVHTHGLRPDIYIRLHKPLKRSSDNTIYISTQHNPISIKELNQTYRLLPSVIGSCLWHIALTAFDKIIFLNNVTKNTTILFNRAKTLVIHNGRDIDVMNNKIEDEKLQNLKGRYFVVGTVSGITKRKGLEQMLYALNEMPECAFCAIGDGPELESLNMLATNLGIDERCYWVGYHPEGHKFHKYFDAFVMCTRSEGFPLALIEAAAYGTPTVLSDIPILKDVIEYPNVVFYELDNIQSLVSSIKQVLVNKDKFSHNIQHYYLKNLKRSIMVNRYIEEYRNRKDIL
jgi:glycosyltransferase involved in cell wall biosynthesis